MNHFVQSIGLKNLLSKYGSKPHIQVTVLGAAGGIGQPLSLLLRNNASIRQLNLYDVAPVEGIATDLSHCDHHGEVTAYGKDNLDDSVKGSEIVIIPAGLPRKPGMTRDDLFKANAGIVANLVSACARNCPDAHILLITNPVNSNVPIACEILKQYGVFNPKRVMGVTKLDAVRAISFFSDFIHCHPHDIVVPVVGGHAGETIVPLFSLSHMPGHFGKRPKEFDMNEFTVEHWDALTRRVQFGGDEVVNAKQGAGSATLAMAYAGSLFANEVIQGLEGEKDVYSYCYIMNNVTRLPYFATRCHFGKKGIDEIFPMSSMTDYERENINKMLPILEQQIDKGIAFGKSYKIKK